MIRQQRDASVLEVPMTVFDRKGLPIFQEQRAGLQWGDVCFCGNSNQ
jgi:hypothetical protein